MKVKRRNYSPSHKVSIVRELLEGGDSLSKISEKYHIHPTQTTRWKKQLFEGAVDTFSRKPVKAEQKCRPRTVQKCKKVRMID